MPYCPGCGNYYTEIKPFCGNCGVKLFEAAPVPASDTVCVKRGTSSGVISLVSGIIGMFMWIFPVFSVIGLVTGIISHAKGQRLTAKAGIILSVIGLSFFVIAYIVSAVNGFNFDLNRVINYINLY